MALMQSNVESSLHEKSGVCVIGHFPDYVDIADKIGGFCFDLPEQEMFSLSAEQLWNKNCQFLQERQRHHDVFLLVTNQKQIRKGSWLEREFAFLKNIGACILPVGDLNNSRALHALI